MHPDERTSRIDRTDRRVGKRLRRTALLAPLVAALALAACGDDDSAGPEEDVSLDDLAELDRRVGLDESFAVTESDIAALEPSETVDDSENTTVSELAGQTVTVSGEVTSVIDGNSFVVGGVTETDPAEFNPYWSEGVLVVSTGETSVAQGDVVQIVGEVVLYDTAQLETTLGTDLDDALYDEFEGTIALQAQSVNMNVPSGG